MALSQDTKQAWHRPVVGALTYDEAITRGVISADDVVVADVELRNDPLAGVAICPLIYEAAYSDDGPPGMIARLVLLCILLHTPEYETAVSLSYQQVARECDSSRASVKRAIRALARDGWIAVEEGRGTRRPGGAENLYTVRLPERAAERLRARASADSAGGSHRPAWLQRGHADPPDSSRGVTQPPLTAPEGSHRPPDSDSRDSRSRGHGEEAGSSRPAQPASYVSEVALNEVRTIAPGWDRQNLLRLFNEFVSAPGREKPRHPDRAFLQWVRRYTNGRPA